jgi:N-acetylmuramoyl-L-alanine amidase
MSGTIAPSTKYNVEPERTARSWSGSSVKANGALPGWLARSGWVWLGLSLVLGWAVAGVEASGSGTAVLQGIRYSHTTDYTRVVLDVDRFVKYEVGRVAANRPAGLPERIYVDLFSTTCGSNIPESIALDTGPVQGIRISRHDRSTDRLVLDLRGVERYEVFRLEAPDRIVIDLWRNGVSAKEPGPPADAAANRGSRARKLPLVVLDPGHGGSDPGAIGPRGLKEKDVILAIAREVRRILEEGARAQVVLTREGDTYLSLEQRTRIANARNADLFISIHANASTHRNIRGVETYYLDNTTDKASLRLAALENRSAGAQLDDLAGILRDLRLSSNANESQILARTVQRSLTDTLRSGYRGVEDLGAKGNLFFVLIGAHMPSVLVEVSFISNPVEGRRLSDPAYRRAIAQGIARGIESYVERPAVYRLFAEAPAGER